MTWPTRSLATAVPGRIRELPRSHGSYMRSIRAAAFASALLLPAAARAQSPDARAAIAVADSALAAITRGDAVGLTDLTVPDGNYYPTRTRDGITTYSLRTRAEQRAASITGVVTSRVSRRTPTSECGRRSSVQLRSETGSDRRF